MGGRDSPRETYVSRTAARHTAVSAADSDLQVLEYLFPSHVGSKSTLTDMWTSFLHARGSPGLATPSAWYRSFIRNQLHPSDFGDFWH